MEKANSIPKRILAIIFVVIIAIGFVRSNSYARIERLFVYLGQKADTPDAISVNTIEGELSSTLYNRKELINLNGTIAKSLNMRSMYSNMGMYVTDNNYIVSAYPYTTTDYEYDEITSFKQFLDENNINLLYVNEPIKYVDDSLLKDEFGIETYSNSNTDLFMTRINDAGINTIDLRDNIAEEGLNVEELFYRTDHHWTTEAGLWATMIIADGLNNYCGYQIDTSIYDENNYDKTEWEKCWLGEQGRKIAETYVGLDDYTELKPNFPTSYTFYNGDGTTFDGTFDAFVNESVYNTENDVYANPSWHYSYNRINCINNNVESGKVLVLCDSYDHVTVPFLSLGVREVDSLVLRSYDDTFSLRDYIVSRGYDTVIIAYAQFMIGAHDNETNANYRMFTFEY